MQADDSRQHQLLWEENQRLKEELKRLDAKARHASTYLQDEWGKDRREMISLRLELDELRSSATATSSDQISIQLWQDRALDAERRAEEAELQLSKIQGTMPGFIDAWRVMGQACTNVTDQAFANVTGQVVDDSKDAIYLPGDE